MGLFPALISSFKLFFLKAQGPYLSHSYLFLEQIGTEPYSVPGAVLGTQFQLP